MHRAPPLQSRVKEYTVVYSMCVSLVRDDPLLLLGATHHPSATSRSQARIATIATSALEVGKESIIAL